MNIWTGIITDKLTESKSFYQNLLKAELIFESDWFVLLNKEGQHLAFMLPNHETQNPLFKNPIETPGIWIGITVDDVDAEYQRVKADGFEIAVQIRDEPWGDRHFAVKDPNGIGVDFVKHISQ